MSLYYIGNMKASSNDIYHYGILGMKWGVRRYQNADGSLTEAGKERYLSDRQISQVHEVIKNSRINEDISEKVFEITNADKAAILEARKELLNFAKRQKELEKEADNLFDSKEFRNLGNRVYYMATAEIADNMMYYGADNLTLSDMAGAAFNGVFGNGGQEFINEYSLYAYKNNLSDDAYRINKEAIDLRRDSMKASEKIIQTALDAVGGHELTVSNTNNKWKAANAIVWQMANEMEHKKGLRFGPSYSVEFGSNAYFFNDDYKKNIKIAEELVSNIERSRDSSIAKTNTWNLLNNAVRNLGMGNMKATELSKSDWNRINAEIRKLRQNANSYLQAHPEEISKYESMTGKYK